MVVLSSHEVAVGTRSWSMQSCSQLNVIRWSRWLVLDGQQAITHPNNEVAIRRLCMNACMNACKYL